MLTVLRNSYRLSTERWAVDSAELKSDAVRSLAKFCQANVSHAKSSGLTQNHGNPVVSSVKSQKLLYVEEFGLLRRCVSTTFGGDGEIDLDPVTFGSLSRYMPVVTWHGVTRVMLPDTNLPL